jgi:hypothetical protein
LLPPLFLQSQFTADFTLLLHLIPSEPLHSFASEIASRRKNHAPLGVDWPAADAFALAWQS